jgi:hypothetical protein
MVTVEELYETDHYAWTQDQARRLRELKALRPNLPLDLEHLAEDIEDMGLSERREVRSQTRRVIEHLLKLEWSRAGEPRAGWHLSIADARVMLRDELTGMLRRTLEDELRDLYADARKLAALGLRKHGEAEPARSLPADCPYTLDDILRDDWCPANRHGIVDPD